jgi:uncharacterized UBP type Zn finger protein
LHYERISTSKDLDSVEKVKLLASFEFVKNLQMMFASMLLANVKYQDPMKVLESLVDDNGHKISIFEQKDIGEFFLNLLDRLQDGLFENKQVIRKMMNAELAYNVEQSASVVGSPAV